MYILIDHNIPDKAKASLSEYGQIIEFETNNITYDAISSHPDIFCCQTPDILIVAPNIPEYIIKFFQDNHIQFIIGKQTVGMKYPFSSHYNAVVTKNFLIHNTSNTDKKILENCTLKNILSVNQGYTRCNLIEISDNIFLTSDFGIYKQLVAYKEITIKYVKPDAISLPGVKNGFIGGCCGIYQSKLFIIGNLEYLEEGIELKEFLYATGIQIIELYNGPLFDGGSIFFLEC